MRCSQGVERSRASGSKHTRIRVIDGYVGSPVSVQIEMRNDNDFWNSYAVQVGSLWRHYATNSLGTTVEAPKQSGLLTSIEFPSGALAPP